MALTAPVLSGLLRRAEVLGLGHQQHGLGVPQHLHAFSRDGQGAVTGDGERGLRAENAAR